MDDKPFIVKEIIAEGKEKYVKKIIRQAGSTEYKSRKIFEKLGYDVDELIYEDTVLEKGKRVKKNRQLDVFAKKIFKHGEFEAGYTGYLMTELAFYGEVKYNDQYDKQEKEPIIGFNPIKLYNYSVMEMFKNWTGFDRIYEFMYEKLTKEFEPLICKDIIYPSNKNGVKDNIKKGINQVISSINWRMKEKYGNRYPISRRESNTEVGDLCIPIVILGRKFDLLSYVFEEDINSGKLYETKFLIHNYQLIETRRNILAKRSPYIPMIITTLMHLEETVDIIENTLEPLAMRFHDWQYQKDSRETY